MLKQTYRDADASALNMIRYRGGSFTVNFCTDDVQKGLLRILNRMADAGRINRNISDDHLIHTFSLREETTS